MDVVDGCTVSGQNFEIEQTVRRESDRLLHFIRTQVRHEADAQDVLQDVFGELIAAYRGVQTIERVTAWLFRVARNKIADRYRRRRPDTFVDDLLPDLSANPEELVVRDDMWDAIQAAIEDLPPAQRQAFVWHELEGVSFREMADLTGETENALRLRKHYATRALRARLAVVYNDL